MQEEGSDPGGGMGRTVKSATISAVGALRAHVRGEGPAYRLGFGAARHGGQA